MSSLTIRLDKETDSLLNSLAETLQESKSALARKGIIAYLKEQKEKEIKKQALKKAITVSSVEEVRKRVAESEASYYLTDKEYELAMDEFFAKELGLVR